MKTIRFALGLGLALAAFAVAGTARADLYGRTSINSGWKSVTVHMNGLSGGSLTTKAGSFTTTLSNQSDGTPVLSSYETYCVDLFHSTSSHFKSVEVSTASSFLSNPPPYTQGDTGSSVYQLAGLGRAGWLVNTFASSATTDDARAALQIAVWKAEYETKSNYFTDLGNWHGTIFFTGLSSSTVANLAVGYLNASIAAGGGSAFATANAELFSFVGSRHRPHAQDQIRAVPEPAALAVAGIGLIGFTVHARRRRRSS